MGVTWLSEVAEDVTQATSTLATTAPFDAGRSFRSSKEESMSTEGIPAAHIPAGNAMATRQQERQP